ncbi:MAG: hypothetical protein ACXAEU_05370 [Candidatus Hodarchaeales archaeon]|jgi:hypothetical protein
MVFLLFDPAVNALPFSNDIATNFFSKQLEIQGINVSKEVHRCYKDTVTGAEIRERFPLLKMIPPLHSMHLSLKMLFKPDWEGVCFGMCMYILLNWLYGDNKNLSNITIQQSWECICGAQLYANDWLEKMKNVQLLFPPSPETTTNQEFEMLITKINNGEIVLLILHDSLPGEQSLAHAVIAYNGRYLPSSDLYQFQVYDPNYPRENRTMFVDKNGRISSQKRVRGSGYEISKSCHLTRFIIWFPLQF